MFRETLKEDDDVVGIVCEGKLTRDQLKSMHALVHERLAGAAEPGLVVDLSSFDGYADLPALLEDLRMDASHGNDFKRVAVVGDQRWVEWGTKLAGFLTRAEMHWFNAAEAEKAAAWARGGADW